MSSSPAPLRDDTTNVDPQRATLPMEQFGSAALSPSSFRDTSSQNEVVSLGDRFLRDYFDAPIAADEARDALRRWTPYLKERIGDRYRIVQFLGAGAFGLVYHAVDTQLERQVAIKLPFSTSGASTDLCQRVWAEARHAAALDHRHIVQVYEVLDVDSVPIIISAYCEGVTLEEWIVNHGRGVPAWQAASICRDVADAIAHAHQRGVLHRDIKLTNILVRMAGRAPEPMLTDFGLARRFTAEAKSPPRLCGTVRYMAPEVLTSRGKEETTASDIYSVGLVLWQLVTGKVPFEGIPKGDLDALTRAKLVAIPAEHRELRSVPGDLQAVILKCIAPDPSARYQSAIELKRDLDRFLERRPVLARKATPVRHALAWCQRKPGLATAVGLLALVVFGSFMVISWLFVREREARALADQRGTVMRGILQEMSGTLADTRLTNVPHMDQTRIALLERSLTVYRELASSQGNQEQGLHDLSVALHRLANAYSQTGRIVEGRKLRLECLAIIDKLRFLAPQNRQYQYDAFMNSLILGTEWRGTDVAEAASVTETAYHLIQSLVAQDPDNEIYLDALAATACDVANDLFLIGRNDEAKALWHEAARQSKDLWHAHSDRPLYFKHAVLAWEQLGNLAMIQGDLDTAGRFLAKAWDALQIVRQSFPNDRSLRSQQGNLLLKMATASSTAGKFELANRQFAGATETWSALARDYPDAIHVRE